jgi:hypothetical protein
MVPHPLSDRMRDRSEIVNALKRIRDCQQKLTRDAIALLQTIQKWEPLPSNVIEQIRDFSRAWVSDLKAEIGRQIAHNIPVGPIGSVYREVEGHLATLVENMNHLVLLKEDLCREIKIDSSILDLEESITEAHRKLGETLLT